VGGEQAASRSIRFKDGTEVEADLVVMAVGIRPNTELAERPACTATAASWSTTPCRP
jgi:NAD(P)H-nitrite reductase large subunit